MGLENIVQLEDITLSDLRAGKVYREAKESDSDMPYGDFDLSYLEDEGDEEEVIGLREVNVEHTVPSDNGFYIISGRIKLADGTEHYGLFGIDTDSQGEHYSTEILTEENGWAKQDEPDFLEKLGRENEQVFPYKYHLSKQVEGDIHSSHQY